MPRWVITVSTVVAISSSCWDGAPATDPRPDASSSDPEDTGSETDTDSGDALPACSSLRAVWGIAPGEVWAAGDCGMAARFDGEDWHDEPLADDFHARDLWASGPGDFIAAGLDDGGFARAYRHDGEGWKPLDTPSEPDTFFSAVWGSTANDVWIGVRRRSGRLRSPARRRRLDRLRVGRGRPDPRPVRLRLDHRPGRLGERRLGRGRRPLGPRSTRGGVPLRRPPVVSRAHDRQTWAVSLRGRAASKAARGVLTFGALDSCSVLSNTRGESP